MKKKTKRCPECDGTGRIREPYPSFSAGDRVTAFNIQNAPKGNVVGNPLVPPVETLNGGTFEDYVYIVQFDDGQIKHIGEGALRETGD